MYKNTFWLIVTYSLIGLINDIIGICRRRREAKKSNYDCSKCKAFDCPNKECLKHRNNK